MTATERVVFNGKLLPVVRFRIRNAVHALRGRPIIANLNGTSLLGPFTTDENPGLRAAGNNIRLKESEVSVMEWPISDAWQ